MTSTELHTQPAGFPAPKGMYDPAHEHDNCGVGFVAALDGTPSHEMIERAADVLINLEHRGAVGADSATGDGAGLLFQIPYSFYRDVCEEENISLPTDGEYGTGLFFLPVDKKLRELCCSECEKIVEEEGCAFLGWREVPIDAKDLGSISLASRPYILQAFIGRGSCSKEYFERKLYVIRRCMENAIAKRKDGDFSSFYIPSLSSRTMIYKGMLTGTQLIPFFPDLGDTRLATAFAIVHQRYSTNTFPSWQLAQPFRCLAHNGEINTLRGNVNRMRAAQALFESELFGDDIEKLLPIIREDMSDSSCIDNALELLIMAGRSLPHAAMMMVPEAWGNKYHMSHDKRAFYEYHAAIMGPWDGPAALVITDGRYIGSILDRNGLRPARYSVSSDGFIVMSSETGVIDIPPEKIVQRGRLQPGRMFLVDMEQHRIVPDQEIKGIISRQKPYRRWVKENRILLRGLQAPSFVPKEEKEHLLRKQHAFGYTEEELKIIIGPMAARGQEAIGSMGNDAALAVLSKRPRLLSDYFKQLFAQVTNPPIDPLREELVMSLMSFVGHSRNLLDETPEHCRQLKLSHPVLTPEDVERIRKADHPDIVTHTLKMHFPADGDENELKDALDTMFDEAEEQVRRGATILILSDRGLDETRAPIPALLASAGLHHHLNRAGLRTMTGIIVETGEAREVNHFALLIGYGANAVCPYVALSTAQQLAEEDMLDAAIKPQIAIDNYITAVKKGLLKTLSRMGISTIRSYCGAQIFEAIGLQNDIVDEYFTRTASRIGGIGLKEIAEAACRRHRRGFPKRGIPEELLDTGGDYAVRVDGERHLWTPEAIYTLQYATRQNDYTAFKRYARMIDDQSDAHTTLRSLFAFKKTKPIPIDEVEPVENITKRFVTAAMSYGSISKEAHESIAIALNRVGGRSNSGEGGEDPVRFTPLPNGDSKLSRTKQIASGRFGVTINYLAHADELQIKIAQGAKPGEGGQLPGHKVSEDIARVRHTTPGVTLISPPPHHDIYSIEDLSQLIYDLKRSNPKARISVKLVSEVGVGTVAAGVAKAKADMVLISGYDGGTGASPLTSIKHAGLPWELGLAETQQTLIKNGLREYIRVQTDGQLKTGRDLAIAALLGAEEYGFGTCALVCLGCIMMRKCHLNTCPVGVATQNEELRNRFMGSPDYVERFMCFIAQDLREHMAKLGFRTVDEMIGRVDILDTEDAVQEWNKFGLDLSPLLTPPDDPEATRYCTQEQDHKVKDSFDIGLIEKAAPALEDGKSVNINMPVRNIHRTIGAMLSYEITQRYGAKGLPDDTVSINLTGSAGQSCGAFLARGITLRVEGDANDYCGKGLSGGKIVIVPPKESTFVPHENIIAGNVILYGATEGHFFANGCVGERFAIRNSGATAVVEGVGDHGCEYMTGGTVVILGQTGVNFAAGMSGGIAYVYDKYELFGTRCNLDMVDLETVWQPDDVASLRSLIEQHVALTGSVRGQKILDTWSASLPLFIKVMPIEYRRVLERMKMNEDKDEETLSSTEEVFENVAESH